MLELPQLVSCLLLELWPLSEAAWQFYHEYRDLQPILSSMQNEIFQVLPCSKENLPAVLKIEQACYQQPWSIAQFLQELDNPVAHLELLWCQGGLAGYLCYWLIAGEMQILNVATAPEWRRKGVAAHLIEHCLQLCRLQGLERAWLEVRVSNQAAISVYQRQGFVVTGVRQGYYRDGEDALLMALECS